MKSIGQVDFMKYLYAEKCYEELIFDQRLKLHRKYQDISPAMLFLNSDTGMNHKIGLSVESYAIDLAELRDLMAMERKKAYDRVQISKRAFNKLEPHEQDLMNQYKVNGLTKPIKGIHVILKRYKGILENEIMKHEMAQEPVAKPIAMSDVILFERIEKHRQAGRKQVLIDGVFQYMTENEYTAYKEQQSENQLWLIEN